MAIFIFWGPNILQDICYAVKKITSLFMSSGPTNPFLLPLNPIYQLKVGCGFQMESYVWLGTSPFQGPRMFLELEAVRPKLP